VTTEELLERWRRMRAGEPTELRIFLCVYNDLRRRLPEKERQRLAGEWVEVVTKLGFAKGDVDMVE